MTEAEIAYLAGIIDGEGRGEEQEAHPEAGRVTGWYGGTLWVSMTQDEIELARLRAHDQMAYSDDRGFVERGENFGGVDRHQRHFYGHLAEIAVSRVTDQAIESRRGSHRGLPDVGRWEVKASTPMPRGISPKPEFYLWTVDPPRHPVLFVRAGERSCILRGWISAERLAEYPVLERKNEQALRRVPVADLLELTPEILAT